MQWHMAEPDMLDPKTFKYVNFSCPEKLVYIQDILSEK